MLVKCLTVSFIIMGLSVSPFAPTVSAADYRLPDGSALRLGSTCPVCGMKVGGELEAPAIYAYTDGALTGFAGVAAAVFKDGKVVGFDDARCLFEYNKMPKRFGVDVKNITRRFVTDFATKRLIDTNDAFLVLGAKIRGFMGYALIPFSSGEQADEFRDQYGGKRIIRLKAVSPKELNK